VEQQATDILDVCFSAGTAGIQTGGEAASEQEACARRNIRTILEGYDNDLVKVGMRTLLQYGRPHDTMHNKIRFGFDRVSDKNKAFVLIHRIVAEELGILE
jgi:hypothetical protein